MQWGVPEVLGEALVVQPVAGQRHRLVFGQCHADDLAVHLLPVQMAHRCGEDALMHRAPLAASLPLPPGLMGKGQSRDVVVPTEVLVALGDLTLRLT